MCLRCSTAAVASCPCPAVRCSLFRRLLACSPPGRPFRCFIRCHYYELANSGGSWMGKRHNSGLRLASAVINLPGPECKQSYKHRQQALSIKFIVVSRCLFAAVTWPGQHARAANGGAQATFAARACRSPRRRLIRSRATFENQVYVFFPIRWLVVSVWKHQAPCRRACSSLLSLLPLSCPCWLAGVHYIHLFLP